MPPPGPYAVSKSNFGLSKCDEAFVEHLNILIPSLMQPSSIVNKKFNNKIIDGAELFECIKIFVETFKPNDNLPEPQSIFSLTVERSNTNLIAKCMSKYLALVTLEDVAGLKSAAHVQLLHDESKKMALEMFIVGKKMGGERDHKHFQQVLEQKIEEEYTLWREIAWVLLDAVKYCFTEYKTNLQKENVFDLKTIDDLQRVHNQHSQSAFESYRVRDKPGNIIQQSAFYRNLERDIEKEYKRWSEVILNLQSVVKVCLVQYSLGMKNEDVYFKTEPDLEALHEKYRKVAYHYFDKTEKRGTQTDHYLFKQNLQEEIKIEHMNYKQYMTVLMARMNEAIAYYEANTAKKMLKGLRTPGDVHKHHATHKRIALETLEIPSMAPKCIQDRYKKYLATNLDEIHLVWKEEIMEKIHARNNRKCLCIKCAF